MNSKDRQEITGKGLAWAPAIQHPLDRMYLKKIEGIPLMPKIMGWVIDREREHRTAFLSGDAVLVTRKSCCKAWNAFETACAALNLKTSEFRLFIYPQGEFEAWTVGSDIPIVAISRGLAENFDDREMAFAIGHELGHFVCGHGRCQSLAHELIYRVKAVGGEMINIGESALTGGVAGAAAAGAAGAATAGAAAALPIGLALVAAAGGLRALLMSWYRYAELSADRAGLLACHDLEIASSAFLKLGGYPVAVGMPDSPGDILKEQSAAYAEAVGKMTQARRFWRGLKYAFGSHDHPRIIDRFASLDEWRELGCFEELDGASIAERTQIAMEIGTDYLRNELNLALVVAAADYLEANEETPRMESLPLLRKAFIHGATLRDTKLERLIYAELIVGKGKGDALLYTLSLVFADSGNARKVSIPVDYSQDWDFAPDGIRGKFIESRKSELKVLVYPPQA